MSDEAQASEDTIVQPTADELINSLLENSQFHSLVHDRVMNEFVFQDKTLLEWMADCAVEIPGHMTPEVYREVSALLARKLQKAIYFYSMANATHAALTSGSDSKKNEIVSKIVENYATRKAKRPAATVIGRIADNQLNNVLTHRLSAKILKEFWRDRRDALIEARKMLETIGMSANMELKYLDAVQID